MPNGPRWLWRAAAGVKRRLRLQDAQPLQIGRKTHGGCAVGNYLTGRLRTHAFKRYSQFCQSVPDGAQTAALARTFARQPVNHPASTWRVGGFPGASQKVGEADRP